MRRESQRTEEETMKSKRRNITRTTVEEYKRGHARDRNKSKGEHDDTKKQEKRRRRKEEEDESNTTHRIFKYRRFITRTKKHETYLFALFRVFHSRLLQLYRRVIRAPTHTYNHPAKVRPFEHPAKEYVPYPYHH